MKNKKTKYRTPITLFNMDGKSETEGNPEDSVKEEDFKVKATNAIGESIRKALEAINSDSQKEDKEKKEG